MHKALKMGVPHTTSQGSALGRMANLKQTCDVNGVCHVEATNDNNWYERVILVVLPKRKSMSLRLDDRMIFTLDARSMCIAQDSTQSHTSEHTIGAGILPTSESGGQRQKVTTSCINPLRIGCVLDESVFTSYPCDLILLH